MRPTVLICVSHGFHVRNIIYSKLFKELASTQKIVFVLPLGVEIPSGDKFLLRGSSVHIVQMRPHFFEKAFLFLRKNVFAGRERTQTFNLINEMERARRPIAYMLASRLNAIFGRIPLLMQIWQRVEAFFISGDEFDDILRLERPNIVLTANYGTDGFEVRLLRAAKRFQLPSLAIIPSWDNLSSKGIIGENPQALIVWNEIMRDEAIRLHAFRSDQVHICGGLQFDHYAGAPSASRRTKVLRGLRIDTDKPWVIVGTITPKYFAKNIEIVELLNEAVTNGRLAKGLQIVVRLHPQVVNDPVFGDNLDEYLKLAALSPNIKLSIPRVLRWGSITPPSPEDTFELMILLQGASAAIMPASTLAIDACALGCPVVGIGFDGRDQLPYEQSVRRTFDFTHYQRLVEQGGLRISESPEQMIAEVEAYMKDRTRDAEGRDRIVKSHLISLDGHAWSRVLLVAQELMIKKAL